MIGQLSLTHHCLLLPLNNMNEINYYVKIIEEQKLSVREFEE